MMDIRIYPKNLLLARWQEDKKWYKTAADKPPKCLRCGQPLPLKLGHCALSRYIDVQICSGCGTEEAMLDWDGKALPLRDWYAVRQGLVSADITQGDVTLIPMCGFKEVFDQPRRAVWGHPNGFPMSELCYVRADHNGYRWHNTWTDCQDKPDDPALLRELDDFYNSLIELPEFKNLSALRKTCRCYAEQPAEDDPNTYHLFAETPHFHVWLRLITRERDYNLYCHFFYKNWEEKE